MLVHTRKGLLGSIVALSLVIACAPAAPPPPTAAPPKPAATAAPAKPALGKAEGPAATAAPAKAAEVKPAATAKPAAEEAAKPAATAATAKAAAQPDTKALAAFYQGKTVKVVVGYAPGGGYDTYSRLIARHLGKHIPGNPNVIVENMPGAGSLKSANYMFNVAPKDGTEIGNFTGGLLMRQIIAEDPAVEFKPLEFNWLGTPTPDTPACAALKSSGFSSLAQARDKELLLGGTAPGSTTNDIPNTLKLAAGLNIRVIDGYSGTSKIRLAAEQGEIMGGCWGWESMKSTWKDGLEKGEVAVIGQGGAKPHPDLKDVPMMQSLAQNDEGKRLIQAGIVIPNQVLRNYTLPPGVSSDRVQALRDAFAKALRDPELLADAEKSKLDIDPVPAEDVYANIKELIDLPTELKKKLKAGLYGTS